MAERVALLEPHERQRLKSLGAFGWLNNITRRWKRDRYFDAVERLSGHIAHLGDPSSADPRYLAMLMAVTLRRDGSVASYFKARHATDLSEEDDWIAFLDLLGGYVVEQYFKHRGAPEGDGFPVIAEQLRAELDELLRIAVDEGALAHEEALSMSEATDNLGQVTDLVAETHERIERLLAEDVDLMADVADGDVPSDRREAEIAKAALVRLRAADLEDIAAREGLLQTGDREELAERIVRNHDADFGEIAELVIRHTRPPVERGLATRLLPLAEEPALRDCAARLEPNVGRFLRLRTAHWYVFRELRLDTSERVLSLDGRLRYYRVSAVAIGERHDLNPTPHSPDVALRLRRGSRWAEIDARVAYHARSMKAVVARGAGARLLDTVPLDVPALEGDPAGWDRITLWMLGFLSSGIEDANVSIHNLTMAHFEAPGGKPEEDEDRPGVDSVRLKGRHLASHRDACQLIVDGRRMLDVEVLVRYSPDGRHARSTARPSAHSPPRSPSALASPSPSIAPTSWLPASRWRRRGKKRHSRTNAPPEPSMPPRVTS
ncbi:MAG TPA: hypothetical protein VGV57_08005 [Thermoleophilaceae bacterium]|nr:hypothetical protein [Thermoleophilaceae bacterium]